MSATQPSTADDPRVLVHQLRSEARSIQHLLETYLEDWTFISGEPAQGALLFFIDAHDLKAYIDPHRPETLSGFMLEAERLNARNQRFEAEAEIKLLSENILSWLLFDPARQVGLLPSHGEEIDEEIAFQNRNKLRADLALVSRAGQEAEALRVDARRYLAPIIDDPSNTAIRRDALGYFRRRAPALMALLRNDPTSPLGRIDKLVEHSNLAPLSHIDWASYGFDRDTSERLRAVRPDPALVDRWRRYLDGRKERRQNSYRSNRIDGEAVAYIQQLNDTLREVPGPRVAARLVARAMTLVNATLDSKALERAGLAPVSFLRHPRLVALHPKPAVATSPAGDSVDDPGPERRLIVALETYRRHLSVAFPDGRTEPSAEMGGTQADAAAFGRAVQLLVETWKDFETWHMAMAPPLDGVARDDDDSDLRKLVEAFVNDPDVMRLVNEELLRSIDRFGSVTFSFGTADIPDEVPLLVTAHGERHTLILPLNAALLAPVEFAGTAVPEAAGVVLVRNGRELLRQIADTPAERYLGRALLLACGQGWKLAEIYAESAIDVTRLLSSNEARQLADEARLLRAQVRRLHGEYNAEDGRRASDGGLRKIGTQEKDPRVLLERAAQILELRLSGKEQAGPDLQAGLTLAELACALSDRQALTHLQALTLRLIFHLAVRTHGERWRLPTPPDARAALDSHAALHGAMTESRRTLPQLPQMARAVEIIGFQLPQSDNAGPRPDIASRLARHRPFRPPLRVPADLRLDSRNLLEATAPASDAITRFVRDELEFIVKRIDRQRRRELIYAPVWAPYMSGQILDLIGPGAAHDRAEAGLATLQRIADTSQVVRVDPEEYDALGRARDDLDQALTLLSAQAADAKLRRALFHVRMEACYARLLLVLISRDDDKQRLREELAQQYRAIAADYPEASIPYFRLHVVLNDIDRQGLRQSPDASARHEVEAREALERARQLMRADAFLSDPGHWVFSTVQRRSASAIYMEAEKLCQSWHSDPADQARRQQFEARLLEAFGLVRDGFHVPSQASDDQLQQLEATRRANNIVFYASRFITEHAADDSLARLDITRTELDALIHFLCPDTVAALFDTGLVHTIGYAHFALGSAEAASEAGERVVALILEAGDDPHEEETAKLLSDAFTWIRTEGHTLQLQAGASRGLAEALAPFQT